VGIQDSLLERAKEQAIREKCTLSDIVNDALRYRLIEKAPLVGAEEGRPLKTYKGGGLRPGVPLSDNAALGDLMDGTD